MAIATILGFPRIGTKRELKRALESFWSGQISKAQLDHACRDLRRRHWQLQRDCGIEHIPSNDFSLYDQMLDMTAMLGAVPPRYGWTTTSSTPTRTSRWRKARSGSATAKDASAMEMTKWFDTNYHYIVPEFTADQTFRLASRKPVEEFVESKEQGITTRPVLIGPITYLLLGKCVDKPFDRLTLLKRILPVYEQALQGLAAAGGVDSIG